jgi:FKBP-type peptidyl-prolyl cis-trans isomerase FkpA
MKNVSFYLITVMTLLAATSCKNQGFKKTKSGLLYKIVSDGKGDVAKKGQFLKLSVNQKLRDSLLYTSENSMPAYTRVDSSKADYSPGEIFPLLRKGDSVVIVELADTLKAKYGQLPAFIHPKDKITIVFKVMDLFKTEDEVKADRDAEVIKEKQRETKTLEDYLAANKINAEKTEEGTYVVVQSPGDGAQVDTGKQVSIRYTGKLFPSGKTFESNATPPADPFKFVIGRHAVIPGWDDGLKKFKKGGKGTLYIPAFMAYDQQPGPGHKPYENLIFEIEVVDVTAAPPPTAPTGMPPGMRMPQQMPHR